MSGLLHAVAPAYLAAWADAFAVASAALIWVQIAHVTGGLWLLPFRRILEALASALPALTVLFVPIVLAHDVLFPWSHEVDPHHALARTPLALAIGGGAELVFLSLVAEGLRRLSLRQDASLAARAEALAGRLQKIAAALLPPVTLAVTLVSFDVLMGVDAPFRSTVYALYVFAGGSVAALAFAAVIRLVSGKAVNASSFFALGKMLLAMVIFWAYTGFSQLLLVWIADMPEEVPFYMARVAPPWNVVSGFLVVAGFAIPLALLLSWRFKRSPVRVAALGVLVLLVHRVDAIWLIEPPMRPYGVGTFLADVGATVVVGGALVAFVLLRARRHASVPTRDPDLTPALTWEDA